MAGIDDMPRWMRWTPQEVGFWLSDVLGLPEHAQTFVAKSAQGAMLLELTEASLRETFLVEDVQHRSRILAGIGMLPRFAAKRSPATADVEKAIVADASPSCSVQSHWTQSTTDASPAGTTPRSQLQSTTDSGDACKDQGSSQGESCENWFHTGKENVDRDELAQSFVSVPSTIDTVASSIRDDETTCSTASGVTSQLCMRAGMPTLLTGSPESYQSQSSPAEEFDSKVGELRARSQQLDNAPDPVSIAQASTMVVAVSSSSEPLGTAAPEAILRNGGGATARRSASRQQLPQQFFKFDEQCEAEQRISARLNRIKEMARCVTPRKVLTSWGSADADREEAATTPRQGAAILAQAVRKRQVTPPRALTPSTCRNLAQEGYTSFSPWPVAAFSKASKDPVQTWHSRFDRSPSPNAYKTKPWSPVAEGKCVPGAAIALASREPAKPWGTRFDKSPSPGAYKVKNWSAVSEGKVVAGAGAFGTEARLANRKVPGWLRTAASD